MTYPRAGLAIALIGPVLAGAVCAAPRPCPCYKNADAYDNAMSAMQRGKDPGKVATRSALDSRVIVLGTNGQWQVEKPGSSGYHQDTATVLRRGQDGGLQVTQKGAGIKDRSANRYATDLQIVRQELANAQRFKYAITDGWGRPEDMEKYKQGDCADKSFWLAAKLTEYGFGNVRVVLGHRPGAPFGHAWVELPVNGTEYILETTTDDPPQTKASTGPRYGAEHPTVGYFDRGGFHPVAGR
ncbi:MAG: hypothetical protein IT577_06870 [Verrucomicrobiae bacterium]|nr:hypothetical protein [Verrucomicrobiae bacterium]